MRTYFNISIILCICSTLGWAKKFTVFHTNDWQSRLLGFGPNSEYKPEKLGDKTIGGIARLSSILKHRRKNAEKLGPVLTLDSGDFSMGTLFHTITKEHGSELQLLHKLGYDAVCLGNHEFDFRPDGLQAMIESALKQVKEIPPILASNLRFSDNHLDDQGLKRLAEKGIIREHLIIKRGGITFGLFGILGEDAVEVSPMAKPVYFADPLITANTMVKKLRNEHKVDVVIMLSHSGVTQIDENTWGGEEVRFANNITNLDLIVGGHTHTPLWKPLLINSIPIVQAGSESQYVGELLLTLEDGKSSISNYQLHPVDDRVIGDPEITKMISEFKEIVDLRTLKPLGLKFDQPILEVHSTFTREFDDHTLGTFVAASFRKAANADIGFTANGTLRSDLHRGETGIQGLSDLFRITPLGYGEKDKSPGYPLVKIFATPKEIKSFLEIMLIAYRLKGEQYYPRFSGVRFHYTPSRAPLDRIHSIYLVDDENDQETLLDLNSDKLISIATTSYLGGFIWLIEKLSYGLLKVSPKDENGKLIAKIYDAIIPAAPHRKNDSEYKAWQALIDFSQTMKDTNGNGIPDLHPHMFSHAPMIADQEVYLSNWFKNATWIQWTYSFILLVLLFLISAIIKKAVNAFQKGQRPATTRSLDL